MLDDSYDVYQARVKPSRRQRRRAEETKIPPTTDLVDHPFDFDGSDCRCGRPFEEHEEAAR